MATSHQTRIPLASTAAPQTSFYYNFNGGKPTDLTYQGDAHILSGSGNLRLTKTDDAGSPLQSSIGRVLYSPAVALWKSTARADFETNIEFIVKPGANNDDPADGLVFFMAPVGSTFSDAAGGGSFGLFDPAGNRSSVFAVEFDIYVNGEWDPQFRHLGIDIESRASIKTSDKVPDSYLGKQLRLQIQYVGATNKITATLYAGVDKVAEVSHVHDLNTFLPQDVQVGLAAATGLNVALHDVVVWSFNSTMVN